MNNVEYALAHLKLKTITKPGWKSKFADSILDFWSLPDDCRFIVHGYVFKNMDITGLVTDLAKRVGPSFPPQADGEVKP